MVRKNRTLKCALEENTREVKECSREVRECTKASDRLCLNVGNWMKEIQRELRLAWALLFWLIIVLGALVLYGAWR